MADCPKYRYVDSWTQTVLNVFLSDYRGYTPVQAEYVAWQVTVNSINFGPWASADIQVEGLDDLGDVRQSFEYTCLATDTYPKTFGPNSLGGATVQLRYYIQVPVNHVGSPISWDFEIQFIGDCVTPLVPFYSQTEEEWGFAHVPAEATPWWQFAAVPTPVPANTAWISALTCDQHNPDKLYAVWVDDKYLRVSEDAGKTWTRSSLFPAPATPGTNNPVVFSVQARDGQVFLFNHRATDATNRGIWRSIDDGVNWTRLTTIANPGFMSLAPNKLWFAETPVAGGTDFVRMNLDGTGREILGHITSTAGRHIVHALNDDLCLFTHRSTTQIYRVQPTGMLAICPAGFTPWDAVPLSTTVFMAVGTASPTSFDVLVQRTVNAGANWTVITTMNAAEGFALNGRTDSYFHIDTSAPARTDLVMTGHADAAVQQMFWLSDDAGLTWTKILNDAETLDEFGDWPILSPGGVVARPQIVPQVATPSRLATIVG